MNFRMQKNVSRRVPVRRAQAAQDADERAYWNSRSPEERVEAVGGADDAVSYWMGSIVPWTAIDPAAHRPVAIGFDVAIDGPPAGIVGRKSQLLLFGGVASNQDASSFGSGRIPPEETKP